METVLRAALEQMIILFLLMVGAIFCRKKVWWAEIHQMSVLARPKREALLIRA